ncbi:hypothetical protein PIB30_005781 [Stylosanthes scabra]|uniref:phosphopantothenoylcysteine decarboxylase n=1 Tax=Stylosanthes scabra TaxID=79078 RepID=A0ABU6X290_9FABA|nr:hypothetical protein [Stylosanthes scabra]
MAALPEEDVGQNFTTNGSSTMNSTGPGPAGRKPRVLLAACGCQAARNFGLVCQSFIEWAEVRAVLTNDAWRLVNRSLLPPDGSVTLHWDSQHWLFWQRHGWGLDVELQKWADIMVIFPMSANTMAKMIGGLCDNLLTSIIRRWDYKKTLYAVPSLEAPMWNTPLTMKQIQSLRELGITVITKTGEIPKPDAVSDVVRLYYMSKRGEE